MVTDFNVGLTNLRRLLRMEIEAVEEFKEACSEVHLLIDYSKKNTKDFKKYATFNKAAIVLLCTKFEAFFESFLIEYAYYHLNVSSNHSVDRDLYNHLVDCIVNHLEEYKGKVAKRKEIINKLEALCGAREIRPINDYQIEPKLRYGKHGQGEIERLLNAFGFAEYAKEDTAKAFFTQFNSLLNIRNNIVHQDATPSLTHQAVMTHLKVITDFVHGLQNIAVTKMELAV